MRLKGFFVIIAIFLCISVWTVAFHFIFPLESKEQSETIIKEFAEDHLIDEEREWNVSLDDKMIEPTEVLESIEETVVVEENSWNFDVESLVTRGIRYGELSSVAPDQVISIDELLSIINQHNNHID
ncbi:hypothetical protein QA612_05875 [Evansella sp. AB-P1]|uniref:hypothetical protein n=1 Tax=Evansella sp. AB-P1 TaxID=3037653 RepID=UPI00241F0E2E|nr:hypothetical protein [Evansella sp. AB-P1]MDG5787014.1 hypothetical protein [Evansella sp. AB-P1]